MFFYPKDLKDGIKYDGGRDLDSLKAYLEANSSAVKAAKEGMAHAEELWVL